MVSPLNYLKEMAKLQHPEVGPGLKHPASPDGFPTNAERNLGSEQNKTHVINH